MQVLGKETKATLSVQKVRWWGDPSVTLLTKHSSSAIVYRCVRCAVQAAKAKLGDMERQGAFDDKPGKKSGAVKKIEKKVHSIQKKRMKGKGGKTAVRKI